LCEDLPDVVRSQHLRDPAFGVVIHPVVDCRSSLFGLLIVKDGQAGAVVLGQAVDERLVEGVVHRAPQGVGGLQFAGPGQILIERVEGGVKLLLGQGEMQHLSHLFGGLAGRARRPWRRN
jgi:hypothetical protein